MLIYIIAFGVILMLFGSIYILARMGGQKAQQTKDLQATVDAVSKAAIIERKVASTPTDEIYKEMAKKFTRDANVSTK